MKEMKDYDDEVFDYLEYLGYPDYVLQYDPSVVARSIANAIHIFERAGLSYRNCALSIFGLTWTYQIARVDGSTKH